MTEHDVLLQLVECRIKRHLVRMGKELQTGLYDRCGRGITPQEYIAIVDKMIAEGVLTREPGKREGAFIIGLTKQEVTNGNTVNA